MVLHETQRPRLLEHSFVLHAVSSGVPLHLIQPWLGQTHGASKWPGMKTTVALSPHRDSSRRVLPYCFRFSKRSKRERDDVSQDVDFLSEKWCPHTDVNSIKTPYFVAPYRRRYATLCSGCVAL